MTTTMDEANLLRSLQSGSQAQLNGELTEDFTRQSKTQLVEALKGFWDSDTARDCEPLFGLLSSIDAEVVLRALEAIVATSARRSSRKRGFDDGRKLVLVEELSRGWRGNEKSLELATCISGSDNEEVTRLASRVYFEFYHGGSLQVIDVAMEQLQAEDSLGLFNRLIRQFNVPAEFRFALLTRIRFAKAFPSEDDRGIYVRILILAMGLEPHRTTPLRAQLREIALKNDVPGESVLKNDVPEGIRSSALIALTAQGALDVDYAVGSKVEAFLSGESQHSEEFIRALVLNTTRFIRLPALSYSQVPAFVRRLASPQENLRWLEDELKNIVGNQDQAKCQVIKTLLVSQKEVRTSSALSQCLIKIFENSSDFDTEVFDAAADLVAKSAEAQDAFMEAMISDVIPSRRKVLDSTISQFFAKVSNTLVYSVVSNVGAVSDAVLLSALRSNHAAVLINTGRYNFIKQVPRVVIERLGKREAALDAVSKAVYTDIAKNLNLASGFVPGQEKRFAEDLETRTRILQWMLFDSKNNANLPLLEQLLAQGCLEKLIATFEAFGRWWIGVQGCSLDVYFSVFKQLIDLKETTGEIKQQIFHAIFPVLQNCSEHRITPTVTAVATELFQKMCPPNAVDGSAVSAMESMGYSLNLARLALEKTKNNIGMSIDEIAKMETEEEGCPEHIQLPAMAEMAGFLLKLAGCSGCKDWILAIWRNGDRDEKDSVLVRLVHEVASGCPSAARAATAEAAAAAEEAAAAAARLLVILVNDENATKLARGSGVIPRMCELLSSGFDPSRGDLLLALDHLFEKDLFEQSEISEAERTGTAIWFGNVAKSRRHYGSELLKLGVTLTRHCKNSMELVAAGDLNALLSRILELGSFDSSSRSYAFQIVLNLLEDQQTLYQRIVQRIHTVAADGKQCEARVFLATLSDLACRDPVLFLQAAFDTTEAVLDPEEGKQYVILRVGASIKAAGSMSARFLETFSQLIAAFLARSDDVAMELFMKIFEVFPKCLEIVVGHEQGCVLDRALEIDCGEETACRFLETVEKQSKGSVNRALVKAFSTQPGIAKLLRISKVLSRCCKFMDVPLANSIVKALCELDLNHPDAGEIVSSTTSVLRRFVENHYDNHDDYRRGDGSGEALQAQVSDASFKVYLFQQEAMAAAKDLDRQRAAAAEAAVAAADAAAAAAAADAATVTAADAVVESMEVDDVPVDVQVNVQVGVQFASSASQEQEQAGTSESMQVDQTEAVASTSSAAEETTTLDPELIKEILLASPTLPPELDPSPQAVAMDVEMETVETVPRLDQNWQISDEALQHLIKFLWLADPEVVNDLVILIAKHASQKELSRLLVEMLLRPGDVRAFGSPANGFWSRPPGSGFPNFFLSRAVTLLRGCFVGPLGNDADALVSLVIGLPETEYADDAEELLRLILQQLRDENSAAVPSLTISGSDLGKLCTMFVKTRNGIENGIENGMARILSDAVSINPALSQGVLMHLTSLLPQLVNDFVNRTSTGRLVLEFVKLFKKVTEPLPTEARDEAYQRLCLALDPLWSFLRTGTTYLSEAFVTVQMLADAPTDSTRAHLARLAKGGVHLLKEMLPLLQRYPGVLDFQTKAKLLQSQFELFYSQPLCISRAEVLRDSHDQIMGLLPETLKKRHLLI